ncbi:unnamed protein product [Musa acuminata subsp. burmannicoides]
MAMSLTDAAAEPTIPDPAAPATRHTYVPRFLRNSYDQFGNSFSSCRFDIPPHRAPSFLQSSPRIPSNRRGSSDRESDGRASGHRSRRGKARRERNPFEIADEFIGLGISDNDASGGGGEGINFDAYDDIPVEVSGLDVPPPATTFAGIDLEEALNQNIQRCRFVKPTPVQRHAIPILVAGRDLMACAQTGSGKTAAFCFPIISGVMRNRRQFPTKGPSGGDRTTFPRALILSPTRELSCQILGESKKFAYQTGVRVVVAYGGTPIGHQLRDLEKGAEILVATPGRLLDLLGRAKVSLKEIKYLALDEADRMLDMGFEPQIRKIVQQMDMPPPGLRQTMLFSATFPQEIQRLASDFLSNYVFLTVGRIGSSTDLISQRVEYVPDVDKRGRLVDLLHAQRENGIHSKQLLTLVFVETKRAADSLERWLSKNGFPATSIHGDKTQPERERALRSFKSGATPVMVATDVASRGLDIPHVALVINFDLPKDIDDYVHRIGRTGRAGKTGKATAFFNEGNQRLAKSLTECMEDANQEVPDWLYNHVARPSYGGGRRRGSSTRRFGGRDFRKDIGGGSPSANSHRGGNAIADVNYASDGGFDHEPIIGGRNYRTGTGYGNPSVKSYEGGNIVTDGNDAYDDRLDHVPISATVGGTRSVSSYGGGNDITDGNNAFENDGSNYGSIIANGWV